LDAAGINPDYYNHFYLLQRDRTRKSIRIHSLNHLGRGGISVYTFEEVVFEEVKSSLNGQVLYMWAHLNT